MIRRRPPLRYRSDDGRLVDYTVQFATSKGMPANVWSFALSKTYIPWSTWDAFCNGGAMRLPATPPNYVEGTFALKTLSKEHERTVEDVTVRLRRETNVIDEESWTITAFDRELRYLSPAAVNAFEDIMPWLEDPGAYHWSTIKNILVGYTDAAALNYPRLSDAGYFATRRLEALSLWDMVECVAQTMAAKWELAFGECQDNPNPNDFRPQDSDWATEAGGWMLNHHPSLRDGEMPMPLSRFVELHRVELQPQETAPNLQELSDRFGNEAATDLFGEVWARRYGYDALLTDLERSLATPEQLISLGWLYTWRAMR